MGLIAAFFTATSQGLEDLLFRPILFHPLHELHLQHIGATLPMHLDLLLGGQVEYYVCSYDGPTARIA